MREFAGYGFDEAGVAEPRTRARFQEWAELEGIDVVVARSSQGALSYEIGFAFTRVRQIRLKPKSDFFGRPPLEAIAAVLRLAIAHAPATAEVSAKAKFVAQWGGLTGLERSEVQETGRGEMNVERLLRAANWRWARFDHRRAEALAKAAARRDPADVRPWTLRLIVTMELGRAPRTVLARCAEVLAREPANREARVVRVLALVAADDRGGELEAAAWLRDDPGQRDIAVALATHHERHQRWSEALAGWRALRAQTTRSGVRDAVDAAIRLLERLESDESFRRRHLRQAWLRKTSVWAMAALWLVGIGFAIYGPWAATRRREKAVREAREEAAHTLTRIRTANRGRYEEAKRAAETGDFAAMMKVADFNTQGLDGVDTSAAEALAWWKRAAERQHVPEMLALARHHDSGTRGAQKNLPEAILWYERAAEQRSAAAALRLADLFYYGTEVTQDYARAFAWYRIAADLNERRALSRVGYMHERGLGVVADDAAAFQVYRQLADGGDKWAQNQVGVMLNRGQGVKLDLTEAAKWFQRSADQGDAAGEANVGMAYFNGRGVGKDEAEGLKWLQKSADQGRAYALMTLGTLYLSGRGVAKDEARGADMIRRAADSIDAASQNAQLFYAQLLHTGRGVAKDETAARERLEKLVQAGYAPAKSSFAEFHLLGLGGIAADHAQARLLYGEAAATYDGKALVHHAIMCWHGLGGDVDRAAAVQNLREAVERDGTNAMVLLAGLTAAGDEAAGLPPDVEEARQLLRRAAAKKSAIAERLLERMNEGAGLAAMITGVELDRKSVALPEAVQRGLAPEADGDLPPARQPIAVTQSRPVYPMDLRMLGLGGEVLVDFIVNRDGGVDNARVVRSTMPGFDVAAVASVQRWRFKPGVKEGRRVNTHMQVPIVFTLEEDTPVEKANGDGKP